MRAFDVFLAACCLTGIGIAGYGFTVQRVLRRAVVTVGGMIGLTSGGWLLTNARPELSWPVTIVLCAVSAAVVGSAPRTTLRQLKWPIFLAVIVVAGLMLMLFIPNSAPAREKVGSLAVLGVAAAGFVAVLIGSVAGAIYRARTGGSKGA